MTEHQNNTIRNVSYCGAAAFVTFCAISTGLPPSSAKQEAVDTCAAELSDTRLHVDTIPEACESFPVYTNGPEVEGYDRIPAAQFREENSPGLGYDVRWFAIFIVGGVTTAVALRKLGESFTADPDSATQSAKSRENRPPRLPQRNPSPPDPDFSAPHLRHAPAAYDKNVRLPVHDNSPAWLILDAAQKLRAEQHRDHGEA